MPNKTQEQYLDKLKQETYNNPTGTGRLIYQWSRDGSLKQKTVIEYINWVTKTFIN